MSYNPMHLLKTKRFLPLFLTQFLEAFNDNFFKNALAVLVTYTLVKNQTTVGLLVSAAAGIFILPFFLFSATAGQIADKFDKALLTRLIKIIEITAMVFATIGFLTSNLILLFTTLFLMGTHSAFFGPIKYSILPDHLKKEELISANALMGASTFIAILIGTILGSILIGYKVGNEIVSSLGLVIAFVGLGCSLFIPKAPPSTKDLRLSLNIFKETINIIRMAKTNKRIFLSILGMSWFWLIGASFLAQLPTFAKDVIGAQPQVFTLFLTAFSVGIALGSMLSERIQKGRIDATYVPLSILGMSVFIIDLFFSSRHAASHSVLITYSQFLSTFNGWHILIDLGLIAICGGLYIVPLYAMVQSLANETHRSRIIAANNIINALFMVVAAILIALLTTMHISIPHIFLFIGIINLGVAIYICKLLPGALVKSFIRWLLKTCYGVEVQGLENYDKAGAQVLIVANHVSFLDAILLAAFLPDKMMFAVNSFIAKKWWVKPLLSLVDTFPIDPTNPMSTKSLIKAVEQRGRCIIFPEGRLTVTGALMKIYEGPGLIADKANVQILPIRIDGAQYTPFSRLRGKVRIRLFPKITLNILEPRNFTVPQEIKGRERRRVISMKLYNLMTDLMFDSSHYEQPLFQSLLDAIKVHGKNHKIIEDVTREPLNYKQLVIRSFILGNHIRKSTTTREIIGVLLPNMAATAITFFAAHVIGRVPAMLNFSTGKKNILTACQTAKIKTVYTARKFVITANLDAVIELLKQNNINIIFLEDLKPEISIFSKLKGLLMACFANFSYRKLNPKINADDTAVILFTSGSEGTPKGVLLSHKNIQANRFQLSSRVDFTGQDIVLNALPVFHSFGLTGGMLLPILSGIKTFLYPSPLHYRIVPEMIYEINATIVFGTDTFLSGYARSAHPYDFYSVRYIFAGAEKLKIETRTLYSDKFGVRIFEGYGATETSPVLATNTPMQNKVGSVGRFLPKIEYRLENVAGIERGGRLFVKGPNIMKGYYLAVNPGVLIPPENGWYDTGDIVDIDNAGYITILGRAKRFAKIAGEMVSLTAVETYISNLWPEHLHGVISVTDERKGEQLILVTEKQDATRDVIHAHFQKQGIGEISLPKTIIPIPKMLLLGTGKIDYVSVGEFVNRER